MAKKNTKNQKKQNTRSTKMRIIFLVLALIMALGLIIPLFF